VNIANRITIARILIVPIFIASIFYYKEASALFRFLPAVIFGIAVVTDAVDGFIARLCKQKTRLGTILDPLADKMLLISAFICLSILQNLPVSLRIPPWVTIIVISRDAIIVLGFVMIQYITGAIEAKPTILGKATTFFQMITVVGVLLHFQYSYLIWNTAVLLTIASGIDYLIIGSRMFNGKRD